MTATHLTTAQINELNELMVQLFPTANVEQVAHVYGYLERADCDYLAAVEAIHSHREEVEFLKPNVLVDRLKRLAPLLPPDERRQAEAKFAASRLERSAAQNRAADAEWAKVEAAIAQIPDQRLAELKLVILQGRPDLRPLLAKADPRQSPVLKSLILQHLNETPALFEQKAV